MVPSSDASAELRGSEWSEEGQLAETALEKPDFRPRETIEVRPLSSARQRRGVNTSPLPREMAIDIDSENPPPAIFHAHSALDLNSETLGRGGGSRSWLWFGCGLAGLGVC